LPRLHGESTIRTMDGLGPDSKTGGGRWPPHGVAALMAAAILQSVACRSSSDATDTSGSKLDEERVRGESAGFALGRCRAVRSAGKASGEKGPCSCGHDVVGPHPRITRVHYGFTSRHGGMSRLLWPNGCVMSSYQRKSTPPRSVDEMGCVTADCVRAVWSLASRVHAESNRHNHSGRSGEHRFWLTFTVQHEVGDGVSWGLEYDAPTDATKRLAALMDAMGPAAR